MTISSELGEIFQLRLHPAYQAAERMRQDKGASALAAYPPASVEHGAIRLMIGTWESIAIRVRANEALKVPFYQTNPVGYMWDALAPGIKTLRSGLKKPTASQYARNFQLLNGAYRTWLQSQPPAYRTAALNGIQALFG